MLEWIKKFFPKSLNSEVAELQFDYACLSDQVDAMETSYETRLDILESQVRALKKPVAVKKKK